MHDISSCPPTNDMRADGAAAVSRRSATATRDGRGPSPGNGTGVAVTPDGLPFDEALHALNVLDGRRYDHHPVMSQVLPSRPHSSHTVHCHTVHLPLDALLSPCAMCGTGAFARLPSRAFQPDRVERAARPRDVRLRHLQQWLVVGR